MQGATEDDAPHIADNTDPDAVIDRDEALAKLIELAPLYNSVQTAAAAVNEALDLDYTQGAWRGLMVRNPAIRERVRKLLGSQMQSRQRNRKVVVTGNVRGAVIGDVHVPYHDQAAIDLAVKVLKWWHSDVLVHNGDLLDFYVLSAYDQNPERQYRTQDEIDLWHIEVLAPILAAGKCRHIFTPGNHEDRLRRHLWKHPELYGVRSLELPNLLELDHYGIEYASQCVEFSNLLEVSHGTRVSQISGYSAKAEQHLRKYGISTITGHVHRAGRFQTATRHGNVIGQEGGCLCSLEPEYATHVDWVHGLTLFNIHNGDCRIDFVQFTQDYTCIAGKQVFGL